MADTNELRAIELMADVIESADRFLNAAEMAGRSEIIRGSKLDRNVDDRFAELSSAVRALDDFNDEQMP